LAASRKIKIDGALRGKIHAIARDRRKRSLLNALVDSKGGRESPISAGAARFLCRPLGDCAMHKE
jgi:hypothetical protein